MEELKKFLIEAKKQTYANASIDKLPSTRIASNDYEYKKGDLIYHDTYFGGINFMGCEIVYQNNIPLWGMNYYGRTLDETLSVEAMDASLRPALMKVEENIELPIRGPKEFKNKEYTYHFETKGNIECFEGTETICKQEKKIYELKCHGGKIK